MLTKLFYSLLVMTLTLSLSPQSNSNDLLFQGEGFWGPLIGDWGWSIYFRSKNSATYHFIGEGGSDIEAKFNISGDTVSISVLPSSVEYAKESATFLEKVGLNTKCKISTLQDSFEFTYALKCSKGKIFYGRSHRSIDEKRKFNGVEIITTGGKQGVVLEAVRFRRAPDPNGGTIKCKLLDLDRGGYRDSDSLPKGYKRFIILGRTIEKQKINNWTHYWYLVRLLVDGYSGEKCADESGWLFGEFIQPQS